MARDLGRQVLRKRAQFNARVDVQLLAGDIVRQQRVIVPGKFLLVASSPPVLTVTRRAIGTSAVLGTLRPAPFEGPVPVARTPFTLAFEPAPARTFVAVLEPALALALTSARTTRTPIAPRPCPLALARRTGSAETTGSALLRLAPTTTRPIEPPLTRPALTTPRPIEPPLTLSAPGALEPPLTGPARGTTSTAVLAFTPFALTAAGPIEPPLTALALATAGPIEPPLARPALTTTRPIEPPLARSTLATAGSVGTPLTRPALSAPGALVSVLTRPALAAARTAVPPLALTFEPPLARSALGTTRPAETPLAPICRLAPATARTLEPAFPALTARAPGRTALPTVIRPAVTGFGTPIVGTLERTAWFAVIALTARIPVLPTTAGVWRAPTGPAALAIAGAARAATGTAPTAGRGVPPAIAPSLAAVAAAAVVFRAHHVRHCS
ncbi:hypothetical protein [Actinomadura latina]|uniref:Uncharacterized protein n=1 Tax=Actinomadura latina TaxID=163603 RepID=A0A846ZE05_9ACTN|nr:hypothetical protein [Actinomadura latina]NKZ08988.1 hypothetical protein [Actinomadura latina]